MAANNATSLVEPAVYLWFLYLHSTISVLFVEKHGKMSIRFNNFIRGMKTMNRSSVISFVSFGCVVGNVRNCNITGF